MTYNEQRVQELVHDVQGYIDEVCQTEIERRACEQYENGNGSMSIDEQDEVYHEVYDAILLGVK